MESACQNLALGDESVAEGRFADAVVQYRLASLAGDDVPLKLAAAENTYRNQVLSFAIEAMDADRLQEAEEVLCEGLETLKDDADLLMALSDVDVMRKTKRLDDIYRKVESLVEKPDPAEAPSNLAVFGRYLLSARVMELLADAKPGVGGEIQLTDAMAEVARTQGVTAVDFTGTRYDMGNKLGVMQAAVEVALEHPEIGEGFREYLKGIAGKL